MIRTVVSASSALARAGLAAVLHGDSRVAVVGESTPAELSHMIATLEPDVVVEQGEPQFEAVQTPSVVLVDDPRAVWRNEIPPHDERARAVLSRDATADEIVAAVVAVAAGLVAVQPHTLAASMEFVTPGLADRERLSPRESEVLIQLARGAGNKQIAAALTISEHTVKFHLASIFAKLGVSSRTEAVTQGVRRGLIML